MHKRRLRLLVLISACLLVGCASYDPYRSPWENLFSPPRHTNYSASRERRHRGEHQRIAHNEPAAGGSAAPSASEGVPSSTGLATPATTAPANPPASLSLAGDADDRVRTERLLAAVDNDLVRADAQGLNGSQKESYERAGQLTHSARRALANNDCAAAYSLATKASSLAADIAER
jgi:hypothetical protein